MKGLVILTSVARVGWAILGALGCWAKAMLFRILPGAYFRRLGRGTRFFGRVRFGSVNGNITVGEGCWIGHDVFLSAGRDCEIVLGDRVSLNTGCHIVAVAGIRIGSNTAMGEYVSIRDQNHAFDRLDIPIREQGFTSAPIVIGCDVWIGRGVMIGPGIKIGDGVVIGANSVVTRDVPARAIVAGAPARILRYRGEPSGDAPPPAFG